jgi:surface antigen
MTTKKLTFTLLTTLTTLVGLSSFMTTASLFTADRVQATPLNIGDYKVLPGDPTYNKNPHHTDYLKWRKPSTTTTSPSDTSVPSISALGINLSGAYYQTSGNQIIAWNYQNRGAHNMECVEFAYGRSIEKGLFQNNQGIATVLTGDAHTWDDRIASSNYRGQLQTQVRANSIVVWEANQNFSWKEGNGTYTYNTDPAAGHVAFVEKVNPDGSFLISEGSAQFSQPAVRWMKAGTPPATAAKFIYL